MHSILRQLWAYRSTIFLVITPLALLPLPLVIPRTEAYCAYSILLMALYWVTEVIPLAVTSFLPLILFPLMGVMPASDVSLLYLSDTCWLFVGGLIIAVAVEDTGLHKRIALRVLLWFGTSPQCLMLGFMVPTFFLSMWISNTATTAMMLPIVEAVLGVLGQSDEEVTENDEIKKIDTYESVTSFSKHNSVGVAVEEEKRSIASNTFENPTFYMEKDDVSIKSTNRESNDNLNNIEQEQDIEIKQTSKFQKIKKGLTICIPYAASMGGITTVTGTGPNLVLYGQFDILYPESDITLSFGVWMAYNTPTSVTMLLFGYLWLCWFFLGFDCFGYGKSTSTDDKVREVLKKEYKKLGRIRWNEATVLIVFTITALLWFFREPGFMPGWGVLFADDYVSDGTVAMTMAVLLFILPSQKPVFMGGSNEGKSGPVVPVLTWPTVHVKFPWAVLFLLGGGFALAEGAEVSGFSVWLGDQLAVMKGIPPWSIVLVVTIITCLFTECTSNVATASIFIPILSQLAQAVEVHPLYILMPATISTSLAFMLPVATPPNAIAFSFGHLKVIDLVKAGWMLNVIGIAVINLYINTYGMAFFGLDEFPDWADPNNNVTDSSTIQPCIPLTTFS